MAARHPIDAFIWEKLRAVGLAPSVEADRRTLLRRVSHDLVGLPPSAEAVEVLSRDRDELAYERWVDRLLSSPGYGERWARHWFDTIHFADSHGYEHDIGRENAWRFRDYVIGAFNRDIPWSRFIREQLAADFFYPQEPALTAALGYLGAGTFDLSTFSTGPVTFDYLDRDDLVTQTMSAFMSTTANCARCHAHKFDPISQEDYYSLQAVFSGILKGDRSYDEDPAVGKARARWKAVLDAVERRDAKVLLAAEHEALIPEWIVKQGRRARWELLTVESVRSLEGSELTRLEGEVIQAGGRRPDKDTYVVVGRSRVSKVTALRLEVLARENLPKGGPGRQDNGNLHLSEIELRILREGLKEGERVRFGRATADFNQEGWGIGRAMDGDPKTAWGIFPAVGRSHQAVFEFAEPVVVSAGDRVEVVLKQLHGEGHLIGALRLAVTGEASGTLAVLPMEVESVLAVAEGNRTIEQRLELAVHAMRSVATEALGKLPAPSVVYAAGSSVDLVNGEASGRFRKVVEPKVVNVLQRGDFDKPRAVVKPGGLAMMGHLPSRFEEVETQRGEAARRGALANWLAHSGNVLTWRSVVNRVWHYHFGRGLCDTPSDLGVMGGEPSHLELLDWLAVWFRDDAQGSLKALHRLIVTSATYRQASRHREEAVKVDAENRLLWRQNRHRLDADLYRDYAWVASGGLDLHMGGPGIQHFSQGKGPQLTPALDYTAYDWSRAGAGRRSIYRFVWRGIADPFMEALDFPDLGLLAPSRGFSVSALQALTLYNNDFVLHQAERMARGVESGGGGVGEWVRRVTRALWQREPRASEVEAMRAFVVEHGLSALCRVLLNSNEFLFVD